MAGTAIDPGKITRAIQLPAVWLATLILLEPALITGAVTASRLFIAISLTTAAMAAVPLFVVAVFLLQTRFRPELLDDPDYLEFKKRQEQSFRDFRPVQVQPSAPQVEVTEIEPTEIQTGDSLEGKRNEIYRDNRGLFLIHTWRPSAEPSQVADMAVSLEQHGPGPLAEGTVQKVEYQLGPKFSARPIVIDEAETQFRLDVSAYGPMLCVARIHFTDGHAPLNLNRYINF